MTEIDIDYVEIRDRILKLLRHNEAALPADAREAVERYLAHDEYEVALEGLCLELIDKRVMTAADLTECVELGQLLGLDEDTVLRADFWTLLIEYRQFVENHSGASSDG